MPPHLGVTEIYGSTVGGLYFLMYRGYRVAVIADTPGDAAALIRQEDDYRAYMGYQRILMDQPCIVPFCRKCCPVLPEDAEVFRCSGDCICDVCGKEFRDHPQFAYPTGMQHCVRLCDGTYCHL